MAAADPPAGLMDIASTLSQDEIPFKLRCAICNKLAVNAFRLPCCDQSICETCQASLPDTCSVCAHTPVSPDLCKPNKALRTTLKAFLRTEEKKREKERQSTAPVTPVISTPAENDTTPAEATADQKQPDEAPVDISDSAAPIDTKPAEYTGEALSVNATVDTDAPARAEPVAESDPNGHAEPNDGHTPDNAPAPATEGDVPPTANGDESAADDSVSKEESQQPDADVTNTGPGGPAGMTGWTGNNSFNGMNPFMANPMFNFPQGMGMPMAMDPMAATQGMFGDYGMNMTGMGMNMGMNFNGQGMYGSLGWDASQQNMWQGGQDKFNPNAFANGTGPPYGGAFGGSNMSYPSNSDFQSGYYGPGYGRGGYRGRGRGYYPGGSGRGGYGGSGQGYFPPSGNAGFPHSHPGPGDTSAGPDGASGNTEDPSQMNETGADHVSNGDNQPADGTTQTAAESNATNNHGHQLQGIPTIDSLDQASGSMEPNGYQHHMGPGYGRGGYIRGQGPGGRGGHWGGMHGAFQHQMVPQNPGVEGAPAAPRAMRQGLPNTSVLRQRGFHAHSKASISSSTPAQSQRGNSEAPQDASRTQSPSRTPSRFQRPDRTPSPSPSRASRARSPVDDGRGNHREADLDRPDMMQEPSLADRRSRSPSRMSSRRSSRRRDRDEDLDRRSGYRSHRSRRDRSRSESRSRSPSRKADGRHPDRLKQIVKEESATKGRPSSDTRNHGDLASRISNGHRSSRDGHSRRDDDRERDRDRTRDSRRRDRDRDSDRRDRERESERERRQNRDREKRERDRGGDRERERNRGRDRERERKRRRDRSESTNANEFSSQPQARRVKANGEARDREQPRFVAVKPEAETDPYTLEREARNRERLLREQQNRGSVKSSTSKSSRRQERLVGGRRINYKYEDEL